MKHSELIEKIAKLTGKTPKLRDLAHILDKPAGTINSRASRDLGYDYNEVKKIEKFYGIDFDKQSYIEQLSSDYTSKKMKEIEEGKDTVKVLYRPEVCFSAGYGIEVYNESKTEYMTLDKRMFISDKGIKINPNKCEILTVSGNSMSPKWEHGDRFILDKSINHFIDGHIFAFRHNGECYIKEICLLGKRAKAVPLNKEYEPFFIEPEDELTIYGRVLPRVRL